MFIFIGERQVNRNCFSFIKKPSWYHLGGRVLSLNITGLTTKRFFVTFTFMKQGTYKLKQALIYTALMLLYYKTIFSMTRFLSVSSIHQTQTPMWTQEKYRPQILNLWKNQSSNIEQVLKKNSLIFQWINLLQ